MADFNIHVSMFEQLAIYPLPVNFWLAYGLQHSSMLMQRLQTAGHEMFYCTT